MNPAAAFVVDPDTQHLYAAYGRGNIPQLERQKLMTGMCKCRVDITATRHRIKNLGRFLICRTPERSGYFLQTVKHRSTKYDS